MPRKSKFFLIMLEPYIYIFDKKNVYKKTRLKRPKS